MKAKMLKIILRILRIRRFSNIIIICISIILLWLLVTSFSVPNQTNDDASSDDVLRARILCASLQFVVPTVPKLATWAPQLGPNGPYQVVYDWSTAMKVKNGQVTYTTDTTQVTYTSHTTIEYLQNVVELSSKWRSPISMAVFAPSSDFCVVASFIARVRACGPTHVREHVSWHLFWPKSNPPSLDWRLSLDDTDQCSSTPPSYPNRSIRVSTPHLFYPVNVARNVARVAARTEFVLASDVELYPSEGLAEQFLSMMSSWSGSWKRSVFVVPIFEVESQIPSTKEELLRQYTYGEAVYFHQNICKHCQKFPRLNEWFRSLGTPGKIQSFSVVKRHFPFHRWEPIFIGTNEEPFYDERMTWEGFQDKMTQMYELCLLNYDFVILDRAFLTHAVGIKTNSDLNGRNNFMANNSQMYEDIVKEIDHKYSTVDSKCRKH